ALLTALALSGCSVEPTYKRPSVDVPAHYLESGPSPAAAWRTAHPDDDQPRGPWWTLFGDPTLNSLEARVDVSNQTLRKSVAALDVARSVYDRERAGFLPTVTAGAAQSRTRVSQNLLYRNATDGRTYPDHSVGLTASWEPDVFGKIRSQTDAAQASMQASASDVETVRLAMTAELAADYLDLRANDREKALLDQTIAAYQQVYDMMQQRFKLGVSGAGDLA
ncbi:TolC family protein, partial [Pararobbsia alpina]|uniref:TolC family protein n=1 Tax=Pararobbsia alpina TaxID=621374 RepID=UPI0015820974